MNEPNKLDKIWRNEDGTFKSGHPPTSEGRPKGKTLKEFAREYLMGLPDDEKVEYLASLPPDIVWKMAEGNPKQDTDVSAVIEDKRTLVIVKDNGEHN
jgi:hypothetical protein